MPFPSDNQQQELCVSGSFTSEVFGSEIEWARDYDAGLKAIRSAAHDVCLLDNRLGSRTGLELLDACGGAVAALPIINCYVTKPYDFEAFVGVVKAIESFWLSVVKLPAKSRTAA